ncbi:MAG: ECF transporter S component [Clostridia bacterium]|nr:ECF transporter S component [Clostridia bacterium]
MKKQNLKDMVLAAMFLGLGLVLPFLTGQIKWIGNMLLPMHIPVLLCGLICGWQYGLVIGFILPVMRSMLFGMPPLYPTAVSMSFELAAYGFIIGFLYSHSRWQCVKSLYRCMIIAMLSGRIVWGIAQVLLLGLGDNGFTVHAFVSGAFLNAIPGIILQLILIPSIMVLLNRAKLVPFLNSKQMKEKAYAASEQNK